MPEAEWLRRHAALSLRRLWPRLQQDFQAQAASEEWRAFETRLRREWERLFGLLFELYPHRVIAQFLNRELRQVTDFQEIGGLFAAGPGKIVGRKNPAVRPDFDDRVFVRH